MLSTLFRTEPFDPITREMDRFFGTSASGTRRAFPGLNAWRDGENVVVEAEIPGYRTEDVEVTVTDDTLTLRGRRVAGTPEGATALRIERSVSSFERSLRLPTPVNAEGVEATLSDGVLRVTMPLAESARPRRVAVRALEGPSHRDALPSGEPANA